MEAFVYGNYLLKFRLLKMGIPYDTVESIDEEDVNILLGTGAALEEYMAGDR